MRVVYFSFIIILLINMQKSFQVHFHWEEKTFFRTCIYECMTNVGVHWMHFIPVSTSSFWLNIIHTNMHGHTKQGRKRDYFITLYTHTHTRSDVYIVKQIIIWRVCIFVLRFLFIFLYIHTQHFYISSSSHGIM